MLQEGGLEALGSSGGKCLHWGVSFCILVRGYDLLGTSVVFGSERGFAGELGIVLVIKHIVVQRQW